MDQYTCAQFASKPGLNTLRSEMRLIKDDEWAILKNVQWTMCLKMRKSGYAKLVGLQSVRQGFPSY